MTAGGNRPTWEVSFAFGDEPLEGSPTWDDETAYVREIEAIIGKAQALDAYQPGTARIAVDNKDRRFDPEHAAGPHFGNLEPAVQARIRATFGNTGLDCPGANSDRAVVPGSTTGDINGDLDLRFDGAADDWTTAGWLIGKGWAFSASHGYRMQIDFGGALEIEWHDGSGVNLLDSTVDPSTLVAAGERIRLRATLDVDDGAGDAIATFYYSLNFGAALELSTDWTALGTPAALGSTTTVASSNIGPTVGDRGFGGTATAFDGQIYGAAILDGIAGTPATAPRFNDGEHFAPGASTGVDAYGVTWNITNGCSLTSRTLDVYFGLVDGWPLPAQNLGRSEINATDLFGILTRCGFHGGSAFEATLRELAPVHWWKLGEETGSAVIADTGSSPVDGQAFGSAQDGLGFAGIDAGTDATCLDVNADTDAWIDVSGATAWTTLVAVFQHDTQDAVTDQAFTDGVGFRTFSCRGSGLTGRVEVSDDTNSWRSDDRFDDGETHLIVAVRTGAGAFTVYIDGAAAAGASAVAASFAGTAPHVTLAGFYGGGSSWDGRLQHVAIFDTELTSGDASDLWDAVGNAWADDTIDSRIGRICDRSEIPAIRQDLEASAVGVLAAFTPSGDCLTDVRLLEASEGGDFYQTPAGVLAFRNRYSRTTAARSRTPVYTFTDEAGAGLYRFSDLTLEEPLELIRNSIEVAWTGETVVVEDAASIAAFGAREHAISTALNTAAEARGLGEWILSRYKDPRTRVSGLTLNTAAEPRLWTPVLDLEIGDRVRVVWTPGDVGSAITVEALVEGKTIRESRGVEGGMCSLALSTVEAAVGFWIWDESLWDSETRWG